MEQKSLTLDDLSTLFVDEEPVEHDNSPENSGVPTLAPPTAGKYTTRLLAIDVDRDQDGTVRNKKNFQCSFEVVTAPASAPYLVGRTINFIKVSGETKRRKGKDGIERPYVELFDLVKGFDPNFACGGSIGAAIRFLLDRIGDHAVVSWQLDWTAWDKKHFDNHNGDMLQNGSEEKKALFREVSFRGQRHFQADGTLLNNASGNLLKARPYMKFVYPPTAA